MAKFLIVVGTVNGHALTCAQGAAAILNKLGHETDMRVETKGSDLLADPEQIILVCCSTTGQGQVPENVYSLYLALEDQQLNLENRYYGVLALGDSYFPPTQFALGGRQLENALYRSGAKRIGDMGILDAQQVDNYALAAALWVKDWVEKVAATCAAA